MSSITILLSLKRSRLRRDRSKTEDSSVSQGILSTVPTTLSVALGAFRAWPLSALSQGRVKRENNKINQGVLLTLPITLGTANIWSNGIPYQSLDSQSLPSCQKLLGSHSQSPFVRVGGKPQAGMGDGTGSIEPPSLEQSTSDKIRPVTDNNSDNYDDNPHGNNSDPPQASLTLPEHLWDQAYNEIRESDPKLMQLYETILSNKLLDYNFDPSQNVLEKNTIDQLDRGIRRDQMRQLIETGQHKIKLETQIKSGIKQVIEFINPAKDFISSIVEATPGATLPWTVISVALEVIQNPVDENEKNANGIQYVTKRMGWYWGIALDTLDLSNKDVQSDTKTYIKLKLVDIYREILSFEIKSICSYYRNRGLAFLRDLVKLDDWESNLENIYKLENEFKRDYNQYTGQQSINSSLKIQDNLERLVGLILEKKENDLAERDRQYLTDLCFTNPKHDKKRILDAKEDLQWGFISWIFNNSEFREWRDNESSRLLWIKGDPGKGKTMLICGIIQYLENSMFFNSLAYFFCQGTDQRLNKAINVLRGLIYMLVSQQHSLLSHVRKEHNAGGSIIANDVNSWVVLSSIFDNILHDPASRGCCVVIDALDECAVDRKKLLDLIVRNISKTPHIKWVLSSRNFVDIENKLDVCSSSFRVDLEVNAKTMSRVVEAYIRNKIPQLGLLKNREYLHNHVCSEMLRKANGTFLWAALAFKEFEEHENSIAETDDQVLNLVRSVPSDLTELYHRMMIQVFEIPEDKFGNRKRCIDILSTMAVAFEPVQLIELSQLIGYGNREPGSIDMFKKLVQKCGSFLTIREDTVYFVHQTAKDYLTKAGCDRLFESDIGVAHRAMFQASLHVLSFGGTLRRNMYALSHPGAEMIEIIRPNPDSLANIQYSCVYMLEHFLESISHDINTGHNDQNYDIDDIEKIHQFLKRFLLNWLEALCLMKQLERGIVSMHNIVERLGVYFEQRRLQSHPGFAFIKDSFRFMFANRFTIKQAPLQIYVSALMFSPTKSVVRLQFQEELSWIKTLPVVDEHWDSCKYTLFGLDDVFCNYSVSADSGFMATARDGGKIQLWDLSTGKVFYTTCEGNGPTISISSSSGSILLASLSSLGLTMVDVGNDKVIWSCQKFSKHPDDDSVRLQFSGDSTLIAVITDQRIRIIETATGKGIKVFRRNRDCVFVELSIDLELAAEWQSRGILRITNTQTAETMYTFDNVDCNIFALSPGFKFIAIQSKSGKISIRDIASNAEAMVIPCFPTNLGLSFVSDFMLIADYDGVIQTWDITTGESYKKILPMDIPKNYKLYECCFYFSEDHHFLIYFCPRDIKIWDVAIMAEFKHPKEEITSLALSNDAKLIALSFRQPRSICIKSADTGELRHTLLHQDFYSHTKHPFCEMAFSNDTQLLATCVIINEDDIDCPYTVSLWNTETGNEVLNWNIERAVIEEDDLPLIRSLAFSPDATLVVIELYEAILLWDVKTGLRMQTLANTEKQAVRRMSFSANSKLLAFSGMNIRECVTDVEIWNLEANQVIWHTKKSAATIDVFFDVFFNDSTLYMDTENGYIGVDEFDAETSGSYEPRSDNEKLYEPSRRQPVTTRLYNERYVASYGHDDLLRGIYWNSKKLIWIPPEYYQHSSEYEYTSSTSFTSASSVIKLRAPNREILTIEFQRPQPDESDHWTPWQSSLLFHRNSTIQRKTGSDGRNKAV